MPEDTPYTGEQQIADHVASNEVRRLTLLVDHWCPETCRHEEFGVRLLRAFMAATSCCNCQKVVLDGGRPLRPLNAFPDPTQGFKNTPTGF